MYSRLPQTEFDLLSGLTRSPSLAYTGCLPPCTFTRFSLAGDPLRRVLAERLRVWAKTLNRRYSYKAYQAGAGGDTMDSWMDEVRN